MDIGDGLEVNFFCAADESTEDDLSAFLKGSSGGSGKDKLPKPRAHSRSTDSSSSAAPPPVAPSPVAAARKKTKEKQKEEQPKEPKSKAKRALEVNEEPKTAAPVQAETADAAAVSATSRIKTTTKRRIAAIPTESSNPINTFKIDGIVEYDSAVRLPGDDEDDEYHDYVNSLMPESSLGTSVPAPSDALLHPGAPLRSRNVVEDTLPERQGAEARKKSRRPTVAEDPLMFHARPRELARRDQAHVSASQQDKQPATADYIFSQTSFESLGLEQKLISVLTKPVDDGGLNLKTSTRAQSCVLPLFTRLQNSNSSKHRAQNVLLKSETGSGKTLAFLLPILHDLMTFTKQVSRTDGTRALIISPTRELCAQISNVIQKLTSVCVNIVGGCFVGGEKKKSEKSRLRKGIVILVATPGRLHDHMHTTDCFNLQHLKYIVLDEADRLLDLGFEKTIMECIHLIRGGATAQEETGQSLQKKFASQQAQNAKKCLKPKELVHIMASATLTMALKRLALPLMGNQPFYLVDADSEAVRTIRSSADLDADEGAMKQHKEADNNDSTVPKKISSSGLMETEVLNAPKQLQQYFMSVSCKWRLAALLSFLKTHSDQKVMVFLATCDSVDFHTLALREADWPLKLDAEAAGAASNSLDDDSGAAENSMSAMKEEELKSKKRQQFLQPLECKNHGILGGNCPIFRLHGNIPQKERVSVFSEFSAASRGILLCTDVAARGLDLPRLDWILQYDPPCEATDYVHRCGRTARRGKAGSSLLFLLPSENPYVSLLSSHGLTTEALSLQKLFGDVATYVPGAAAFKNTEEMAAVIIQRRLERTIEGNQPLLQAARQAFRSHVRAYATHSKESKGIFRVSSLHLGHVARSFALRDPPKAGVMGSHAEDVLAKIHNGVYMQKKDGKVPTNQPLNREEKKRLRDEKYSLSGKSKRDKKKQRIDDIEAAVRASDTDKTVPSVRAIKKEKGRRKWENAQTLQKLKPISSGGAARNRPSASLSTARPRIGGHAQRQRNMTASEFAKG